MSHRVGLRDPKRIPLSESRELLLDDLHKGNQTATPSSLQPLSLREQEGVVNKFGNFGWLIITTGLSIALIISARNQWRLPYGLYKVIVNNRATTQLVLQVIASLLGLMQMTVFCRLVHLATRLRLQKNAASLNQLHFWAGLANRRLDWSTGYRRSLFLVAWVILAAVPAAVWAGALTPVGDSTSSLLTVGVPQYKNTSNVREYPSEVNVEVPHVRNSKGFFSFSVGTRYLGRLLTSAAEATPYKTTVRNHTKYDNSGFAFRGRSYGVGSSVGLMDDSILSNNLVQSYTFQEQGYNPVVRCIYNQTSEYILVQSFEADLIWIAGGNLPNTADTPEYSRFIGYDTNPIVALGVTWKPVDKTRIVAFAAGDFYHLLNTAQCTIDFRPAVFNVSVDCVSQSIEVTPTGDANDIEPAGNLTHVATRQFELISNAMTNLYTSLVGDSFNNSITQYMLANPPSSTHLSTDEAALAGIKNSIEAMIDDILAAYGSAQLMITKDFTETPAAVTYFAYRLGQDSYIYATFVMNLVLAIAVLVEVLRTRGWKMMRRFDYLKPGHLIVATSQIPAREDSHIQTSTQSGLYDSPACRETDQLKSLKIRLDIESREALRLKVLPL